MVELEPLEQAMSFWRGEGVVERSGGVGREVVHHHPDDWSVGIIDVDQFAHAVGEVLVGAAVGDLDLAPGLMGVEEDEQIDRAVAAIFAIVALKLPWFGGDRFAHLADELGWALVKADDRSVGIGRFIKT